MIITMRKTKEFMCAVCIQWQHNCVLERNVQTPDPLCTHLQYFIVVLKVIKQLDLQTNCCPSSCLPLWPNTPLTTTHTTTHTKELYRKYFNSSWLAELSLKNENKIQKNGFSIFKTIKFYPWVLYYWLNIFDL